MSQIAIQVENLSKAYQLGEFGTGYLTKDIQRWWAIKRGKDDPFLTVDEINDRTKVSQSDFVWSLNNINFTVEKGSALGIIGKNGAGKSTLLKILSQITSPTTGSVKLRGRIASLLEVGTGFHPELTGRENIYLNGAILGMRKSEIVKNFDEIVNFAGVERYIDTPVKRYSSGMYVRLAFAVAAHLESEILIVDEVLAVGDAEFQQKCLGKMGDISKGQGKTVLFVSHNMASISQLCDNAVLLENGLMMDNNKVDKIIHRYMSTTTNLSSSFEALDYIVKPVNIVKSWISGLDNLSRRQFMLGESLIINFELKKGVIEILDDLMLSIKITASDGTKVCNIVDRDSDFRIQDFNDRILIRVKIEDLRFFEDIYNISIWVGTAIRSETIDFQEDCLSFEIVGGGKLTTRHLPRSSGLIYLTPDWDLNII